jgi:hypothetical protein
VTVEKAYEGKVRNTGSQVVKAPYQHENKDSGKVHTGNDLRSTAGGKK